MTSEDIEMEILRAAITLGRAKQVHEIAKSDPSRNGTTGRAVYEAEVHFSKVMDDLLIHHREAIDRIYSETRRLLNVA